MVLWDLIQMNNMLISYIFLTDKEKDYVFNCYEVLQEII